MDIAKVERVYTNYSGVYDHIFGKIFHESRESAVQESAHQAKRADSGSRGWNRDRTRVLSQELRSDRH